MRHAGGFDSVPYHLRLHGGYIQICVSHVYLFMSVVVSQHSRGVVRS